MFISGIFASSEYGWPWIFYTFSGVNLIWCLFFAFLGVNSPKEHATITEAERNFICLTTGETKQEEVWYEQKN